MLTGAEKSKSSSSMEMYRFRLSNKIWDEELFCVIDQLAQDSGKQTNKQTNKHTNMCIQNGLIGPIVLKCF